jgi:RimJ/RimL family protein N-acetyltransferase
LLLLRFEDPHDHRLIWEPPGGGIEPGETPLEAAKRELFEEAGLPPSSVVDRPVVLWRSFTFNGRAFHQPEHFYLAKVGAAEVDFNHMPPSEARILRDHGWWTKSELDRCTDLVEPEHVGDIAGRLGAESPWADRLRIPFELYTERMLLRQWRTEDVEPLAEIYEQPEFLAHMPSLDLDGTRDQLVRFKRRWVDDGFCQWAAVDLETGRLIGRIGLIRHHDWPVAADPVEVGWTLHRDYWGRGLATEGGRASMECWHDLLDDAQLISITRPANIRSRAVMERLGLTYRGVTNWRGNESVWYAIDRRDGS